ncbi:ABC transporter substrate-binding protein [Antarcticimicrobium luteum]|uniref:ABC transporter substrate-binding protein n=2 Tax=Antarcticimicrobium luteum TaxID=2547397 RepID=A0A4R5V0E8_9RHOB|nr:extracellular solute-binding protein [Antarcticimicrobium luteum]TDK45001.1 ABC transporter substrate-binding protein [Antarcticimicrobium luteum]
MYGDPALPPDFVSLPYVNPEAPKGGRVVFGNTGGFDSLNPFVPKGTPPWQLRFLSYESLMGRSWDEAFTLYGLLAESVETAPDRSWVEYTLRQEARFSDGSPVTVEDVIWSYETLGAQGHLRFRGFQAQVAGIEQTGPRSLRIRFNTDNRELALIAGLRPILKKAQWQGKDFTASGLTEAPIGTGAYVVTDFEAGRYVTLRRNPDYWGRDLPFRRGTQNFDELRIEFYGDATVLFEAFKAGQISAVREFNAEKWLTQYDFPAITRGDVVKSEIPNQRPSGMTGLVMNTRRAPFDDWRVREALLSAFNFDYINDTMTGGVQPRITSYFSSSELAVRPGPAAGRVRTLLAPYADSLPPGALEGYSLPMGDGTARNRDNLRRAMALLNEAGWRVQEGVLRNAKGGSFGFSVLLRQADGEMQRVVDLYSQALRRLGIEVRVNTVDDAQYAARIAALDFDMTNFRRDLSLSPGNEQRLYWGSAGAGQEGTRNLMGMASPAADAMIDAMLTSESREDFTAAVRALDRVLTAGRYVIPIWQYDVSRIAHIRQMKYPADRLPIYGDGVNFMPDVWWYEEE